MAERHEVVTGWCNRHVCCDAEPEQRDRLLLDYAYTGVSAGARVVCLCHDDGETAIVEMAAAAALARGLTS